jgi:putative membrane protein
MMFSPSYASLAPLDAILNATAAILLLAGYIAIRRHHVNIHRACMISAFTVSVAFFISYCIYHYHVGDVRFGGQGLIRPVYFTILSTHIVLAVVIVPLALITLGRALRGRFVRHRRIARWTWPIWMYVSVTGVVVYLMVYLLYPHLPPAATAAARASRAAAVAAER